MQICFQPFVEQFVDGPMRGIGAPSSAR